MQKIPEDFISIHSVHSRSTSEKQYYFGTTRSLVDETSRMMVQLLWQVISDGTLNGFVANGVSSVFTGFLIAGVCMSVVK